eukprot:12903115-Prorocentrum_lima.AAC.1
MAEVDKTLLELNTGMENMGHGVSHRAGRSIRTELTSGPCSPSCSPLSPPGHHQSPPHHEPELLGAR